MKVASCNMAQSSVTIYHREEKITFYHELLKAKQEPQVVYKSVEEEDDEEEKNLVEQKQKNDLIESLMAYLDRREHVSSITPIKQKEYKEEVIPVTDELPVLSSSNRFFQRELEVYEHETLLFTSTGQITTEEGKDINFSYDLELHREFYNKNRYMVDLGLLDPLVLNLDNKGVSFSDKKIQLDLDNDGNLDTFNMLNQGNGFLVLDKNNNDIVDNGSELFGPTTNNGFNELKAYDQDDNHWIDENDLIFSKLKVWTFDEDGKETLINIKDTNIGAIYLDQAKGKFDYKTQDQTIARITGSSVYLRNDGSVGAVHEIHV